MDNRLTESNNGGERENSEMRMKRFFVSLDGEREPCSGDQYSTVRLDWNGRKEGREDGRKEGREDGRKEGRRIGGIGFDVPPPLP